MAGVRSRPRLAVCRSLKHISAQIIDDSAAVTMVAAHDREVSSSLKKIEKAAAVGKLVAERALKKGITSIVFDRRHYKYHGRVKALADAARDFGLKF